MRPFNHNTVRYLSALTTAWLTSVKVEDVNLFADADIFVRVLSDKDVDPHIQHGSLQGRSAHPLPQEVGEARLLLRLQHALITL